MSGNFATRIEKLERMVGAGLPKLRVISYGYDQPEEAERARAEAIAEDVAARGPIMASERLIEVIYGSRLAA